jgi:zinc/manganese transport system substrate-binding protein
MRLVAVVKWFTAIGLAAAVPVFSSPPPARAADATGARLKVLAAENFYGDIASQLGGDHVQVTSIMSDPNVDPHEYEADPKDAMGVAQANLVIQNGADYDNWMPRLLSASPNASRVVLTGASIGHDLLKDNPHVWYSLKDVRAIAAQIVKSYEALAPADQADFEKNRAAFDASLDPIEKKMESVRHEFAGTPVALTETIFLYQTDQMKLNVLTPTEFQEAIAQGNDPPAKSIAIANTQVSGHQVKVLIENIQTVTPITMHLQQEAKDAGIPVVGVSETMPPGEHYQIWMLKQLQTLESALKGVAK